MSYRSALRHAPAAGREQQEWLGAARQRAEIMLNTLESRALRDGPIDAAVAFQIRVVRERIRLADAAARGVPDREAPTADRAAS